MGTGRRVSTQHVVHDSGVLDRSADRTHVIECRAERNGRRRSRSSPRVGFRPTRPQAAAGMRIDPPVSVPIEAKHMPSATDAADPPDDPPVRTGRVDRMPRGTERRIPRSSCRRRTRAGWSCRRTRPPHRGASRSRVRRVPPHGFRRTREPAVVPEPRYVEQILDGDRHAVQWSTIAPGRDFAIRIARLRPLPRRRGQ